MINSISSWAGQIVIAVVIVTILEMLLPNGNNKKYIKTIIGIYILFIIVSPIVTYFFKENLNFDTILGTYSIKTNTTEEKKDLTVPTNNQVEKLYIKEVEKEIEQEIEKQGYETKDIETNVNIDNGEITYLKIIISKTNNENNSVIENSIVETINIQISKNEINEVEKNISEEEFEKIREALEETYKIEKEKIIIEEE
ncbi:MAG: hypothetical protein E7310_07010 [Clostridiales bacterium]|nr:hypothetical protein [Clostridiales bacterium]